MGQRPRGEFVREIVLVEEVCPRRVVVERAEIDGRPGGVHRTAGADARIHDLIGLGVIGVAELAPHLDARGEAVIENRRRDMRIHAGVAEVGIAEERF